MAIASAIFTAVLLLSSFTSSFPTSPSSQNFVIPTKRQEAAAPSATTDAKRYFHNCKGYLDREKEAWDDANTLAKAALDWQAGGNFQPDADLYMGKGSTDSAMVDRIKGNLKNAVAAHGRNWIWPESSIDVWCWENGTNGLPPKPDDAQLPWFHIGYTIVFCPRFWSNVPNPIPGRKDLLGKYPLKTVLDWGQRFDGVAVDPDLLAANRAHSYLHELLHMDDLVSKPAVEDLAYGAGPNAALSFYYGTSSKEDAPSFPTLKGEWGTSRNADSYAFLANSIYFRENLKQQEPPMPKGNWKDTPRSLFGPREADPASEGGINGEPPEVDSDTLMSQVGTFAEAMDDKDIPLYEPPPPPPACEPSNIEADPSIFDKIASTFCGKLVSGVAGVFSLGGNDLDPAMPDLKFKAQFSFLPANDGKNLGCGLSCIDTFTNMTQTCQTNSHSLTGKANITMGCGSCGFEIQHAA